MNHVGSAYNLPSRNYTFKSIVLGINNYLNYHTVHYGRCKKQSTLYPYQFYCILRARELAQLLQVSLDRKQFYTQHNIAIIYNNKINLSYKVCVYRLN